MIRFFDVLFSLLGLLLLFPFLIIISLWVILDSKGPVFYRQIRVGKNDVDFILYKFRTMQVNSDRSSLITIGNRDFRLTRSGYIIRKYKLDEFPQLFNVLIGNMSLVGPRPEVRKFTQCYTSEQRKVLSVLPGITDYASVSFRNENDLLSKYDNPEEYYIKCIVPQKISFNMIYINNRSVGQYFRIILMTIFRISVPFKFEKNNN
jgi:lipopolysaccharide/colanic/teichoic acid biosynthesis glycosyltransferase